MSGSALVSINEVKLLYCCTPGPVNNGTGDCLRAGKPPRFVTSHSDQLSLLSSAGRKISTGHTAVTLCGWGVTAGMVYSTCGLMCGWQVSLINTCHIWLLYRWVSHDKALYKSAITSLYFTSHCWACSVIAMNVKRNSEKLQLLLLPSGGRFPKQTGICWFPGVLHLFWKRTSGNWWNRLFYRPDVFRATQPSVSEHRREHRVPGASIPIYQWRNWAMTNLGGVLFKNGYLILIIILRVKQHGS